MVIQCEVCVELCAPPCAECAELEEESKANKLSIAELSESKVWGGGGVRTWEGVVYSQVGVGIVLPRPRPVYLHSRFHPSLKSEMQRRHRSGYSNVHFTSAFITGPLL